MLKYSHNITRQDFEWKFTSLTLNVLIWIVEFNFNVKYNDVCVCVCAKVQLKQIEPGFARQWRTAYLQYFFFIIIIRVFFSIRTYI